MKYLADADVLSEATRRQPDEQVVAWLEQHEPHLIVNPIILGELEYGILRLPEGRRRTSLHRWFREGAQRLPVVSLDTSTAGVWARLLAELRLHGTPMPVKDSLIAASALQHGMTVATRNTRDYRPSGVILINPFCD